MLCTGKRGHLKNHLIDMTPSYTPMTWFSYMAVYCFLWTSYQTETFWVLRVQTEQPFWHMPLQSASFGLESQTPWPQETRKFEKQLFKNWPKGLVWWWNTFNPTSREGEAGASLWVWDQTGPHRQTLSQKQKQIKMDTRGWEMAQLEKCVLCLF